MYACTCTCMVLSCVIYSYHSYGSRNRERGEGEGSKVSPVHQSSYIIISLSYACYLHQKDVYVYQPPSLFISDLSRKAKQLLTYPSLFRNQYCYWIIF